MPARLARSNSQTDLLRIAAAANQPIDTIARIGSPSPAIGPGAPRYCVGLFGFGAIANGGNAATAVSIVGASTVLIGAFIVLSPCLRPGHKTYICSIGCRGIGTVTTCPFCNLCDLGHAVLPRNQRCALGRRRNCGDLIAAKRVGRSASLMQKLSVCSSTDHGCGKRRRTQSRQEARLGLQPLTDYAGYATHDRPARSWKDVVGDVVRFDAERVSE